MSEKCIFIKADTEPQRIIVPQALKPWSSPWPNYKPPFYESPKLQSAEWAEPLPTNFWDKSYHSEYGQVLRDNIGRPLNPNGRTGLAGRGVLGKYGANQTADGVIFRLDSNIPHVLLIKRKDNGKLAIPGGFIDKGEQAIDSAIRELKEETNLTVYDKTSLISLLKCVVSSGTRSTDNAWIETNVFSAVLKDTPNDLRAGDDAAGIAWLPVNIALQKNLHDDHKIYIQYAADCFGIPFKS